MTIFQLKCFIASYRYESFRIAAERLFLHPTSVGRQISSLEEELGITLFERHHRIIKNTRAGEIFYQGAETILNALHETINSLNILQRTVDKKLSVRILEDTYTYLASYFTNFFTTQPNVNFTIDSYFPINGISVCKQLCSGNFDIVFGYDDVLPTDSDEYSWVKITTLPVKLVVGRQHAFAGKKSVKLSDLQGAYIFSGDFHNETLEKALVETMQKKKLKLPVFSEPFSRNDMLLHVSSGHGMSFIVSAERISELWNCVPLDIDDFHFEKPLFAIWYKKNENPMLKSFINLLPENLT